MANWAVCIPADVLKSRLQTAPHGKYPSKFETETIGKQQVVISVNNAWHYNIVI